MEAAFSFCIDGLKNPKPGATIVGGAGLGRDSETTAHPQVLGHGSCTFG